MSAKEIKALPGRVLVITGGIACGKSTVGKLLEEEGIPVIDTDALGHAVLMREGGEAFAAVVDAFGDKILGENGEIHRPTLGRIVFSDDDARQQLNHLVHPHIARRWQDWVAEQRVNHPLVAVQIPLFYEVAVEFPFDGVICVACDSEIMEERLLQRGLSLDAARKRIRSQLPIADKAARADFTIWNRGSLDHLKADTVLCLKHFRKTWSTT